MPSDKDQTKAAAILDEQSQLSLSELCRACGLSAEYILALVEEGVIEPQGRSQALWRFSGISVRRVRRASTLERDLGINLAGAALAVELLEEIERLRVRLARFERRP
ncbi:chaperone modulator CbpM [Microbulbifer sp. 2201CG32-9]|uniref:chaperone modulator CbpM n=1 Tax=unclassified Microbulbifer TaxID=2619833 RepID=UPI00345B984E